MSEDQNTPEEPESDIFELLTSLFGGDRDAAERALAQSGINPDDLRTMGAQAPGIPPGMEQMLTNFMSMGGDEGNVNWNIAHDVSRKTAIAQGDPSLGPRALKDAQEALKVADLWLASATDIPAAAVHQHVWSRSEWVEATLDAWKVLIEPVTSSVAAAIAEVMRETGMEIRVAPGFNVDPTQMMRHFGSAMFGMQAGNAVGTLAQEVLGAGDIGVALTAEPTAALVPVNIAALAENFEEPEAELRLFVALREMALARLFTHAPWLQARLAGAVEDYASGIAIDMDQLEETVRSIDPENPQELQRALGSAFFTPTTSPQQQVALTRLETLLALVDGWVDVVVAAAAEPHLPRVGALREIMTRRRAVGGPAEQTFAGLVGLEMRPRRLRDASRLWTIIGTKWGQEQRDNLWSHPDLLPTTADLDDPEGFEGRRADARAAEADLDDILAQILDDDARPNTADGDARPDSEGDEES